MNQATFEIFKSKKNGEYYFRLKTADGDNILASEGYTAKASCEKGIDSVKKNAPLDERYLRKDAPGNYRFNLKAANGEIIGRSEGYTTEAGRESGIESVKNAAPDAGTDDLT
ncbi:MAG: hypothetical protein DI535_14320 [Citrobacter freundii]|nr:MAG: hypothetical protein DI535_14320 [Citrobacter freundii]